MTSVQRDFKSHAPTMADKLEPLDDVTRISDAVIRILGGNPGKFTLQGRWDVRPSLRAQLAA